MSYFVKKCYFLSRPVTFIYNKMLNQNMICFADMHLLNCCARHY